MTVATIDNDILKQYSLNFLTIKIKTESKKRNIMDNLHKYMIKSDKIEKENLSLNIDEMLYGKK